MPTSRYVVQYAPGIHWVDSRPNPSGGLASYLARSLAFSRIPE